MRNSRRRLQEQQAAIGRGWKKPAPPRLFDQVLVVFGWFEPMQRQFEAVLPARFSMAASGIAARLGKDWDNLVGEIDGRIVCEACDRDRRWSLRDAVEMSSLR